MLVIYLLQLLGFFSICPVPSLVLILVDVGPKFIRSTIFSSLFYYLKLYYETITRLIFMINTHTIIKVHVIAQSISG